MPTKVTDPTRRPLAVTADLDLLDDLVRLAAAAGVDLDVARDPAETRSRYASAPLVLVGADAVGAWRDTDLARRPDVILVGRASDGMEPWRPAEVIGAAHVAMLPLAEPWLVDRLTDAASGPTLAGLVVSVIGGRGGAGTTVLAAGLAETAARRDLRTLLVDTDPLGGGIDLVLGWETMGGLRWSGLPEGLSGLPEAVGTIRGSRLIEALPQRNNLAVLCWDRRGSDAVSADEMRAAIDAGRRCADLVVIDMARRVDDAAVVALEASCATLIVVPAELRATVAAGRVATAIGPHCRALSVVVRGPNPGHLSVREVVKAIGLPLAGHMRPQPRLPLALERGESPARSGRGPLADLCGRLIDTIVTPAREAAA